MFLQVLKISFFFDLNISSADLRLLIHSEHDIPNQCLCSDMGLSQIDIQGDKRLCKSSCQIQEVLMGVPGGNK